ncbi:DUF4064 domain-containing protein [Paenisporosarcina sp. TG-14]|uniref:DUF4064 domain-containing protein n=1 Tax=Paenisporosarcina sp. TG-14 TaxID=1231057 RepID=UPI0002F9FB99|nr:DUF4064 domain-containing protein [Paenisporosarcina sp. TG-14]
MSRTGEKALGIIGIILNAIFLVFVTLAVWGASTADKVELKQFFEQEMEMTDPTMTTEDITIMNDTMDVVIDVVGVVGWILVVTLLISVILSIIGVVKVSKSPKVAGILFIFSGMLSGIILLAPILFYIAAIMCFVRKTPDRREDDPFYNNDNQAMRPL